MIEVTLTVHVVLFPTTTVSGLEHADNEKSGGGLTTNVTLALCVRLPLVPVMVSV